MERENFENLRPNLTHINNGLFSHYQNLPGVYDEIFFANGQTHPELSQLINILNHLSKDDFLSLCQKAQNILTQRGVTFTVYSEKTEIDKIFPFDPIPRIISQKEWQRLEAGLKQRIKALNAFLNDIYSKQTILTENIIPSEMALTSPGYIPALKDILPPSGTYVHIAGIDLIRNAAGELIVLEDNLRVPSGISYVLENRKVMKELFSNIFSSIRVRGIDDYPMMLRKALHELAPHNGEKHLMVLLTPGPYNSAYFEHTFLAKKMGCPLVQSSELFVENNKVYLKTIDGPKRVHIIYRRTDDDFIDPTFFNPKSLLGIPGLVKAYRAGNIVLANALGNGVADDKGIYPYVPEMIRHYLSEEPILSQVHTYHCSNHEDLKYVLSHLDSLVVKLVNQSGGYGLFIGAKSTKAEIKEMHDRIIANPRLHIAQPLEELSTCPTFDKEQLCARRVDYRPFIVTGLDSWVLPGGLTRVALQAESYVVNSSQGGGSKDTWILE